ncbi:MAG: metallophosphoesterase [Myxococcota bacterium]|nr:metallophosphoesterase [Myxococcota bacterium]
MFRLMLSAAISGAIHYYVWHRYTRRTEMPVRWRRIIAVAMVVLWISIPLTTALRNVDAGVASAMSWVSMPWMAFAGLSFVVLIALDAGLLAIAIYKRIAKKQPIAPDLSRRRFLARVTGGTAAAVAGASVARGMIEARGEHEVVDVEITLPKLPKALDGFTIVQLTDLHVGLTIDRHFVQRVVDKANKLSPDLVALTGDFVDGKVADLHEEIAPLAGLRAKHGVFAVTGNHEYYSGVEPWVTQISTLGVRYLRNERVVIGDANASFELAGVEDHNATGKHKEDLAAATLGRDPNRALVLLAHQPRQVKRAALHGVDLQLSGHTHGGQIWPWHYIVKLQQGGLLAGRYQHQATQLYVSRGCGYWGPPVRVLAPLEITRVILRAA